MANCAVCKEDIVPGAECPRCGYDNSQVREVSDLIGYWGNVWGIMSFLLIFPPMFMLLPGVFGWVDKVLQPIASIRVGGPIALLNAVIIAFFMFGMRDELHLYTQLQRFKERRGRPLPVWGVTCFVIAVLLIFFLSYALAIKDLLIGPKGYSQQELEGMLAYGSTGHILLKLIMTGCLIFIFVFLSLAAGFLAAFDYGQYVEARMPAPIYLNERRLLKVVLDVVRERLASGSDLRVSEMHRKEDGGISLNVQGSGQLKTQGGQELFEEKSLQIEADRWGRVLKISELGRRLVKVES